MGRRGFFDSVGGATIVSACVGSLVVTDARAEPETVYFASADGQTQLVGYLFAPQSAGPHPAVVMLHGRAGPYSSNINEGCTLVARNNSSPCNASSLSKRHAAWGVYWADHGYLALLPDSFGPRNKAHGFGRFTHDDPDRDDVNERTVRPLDAEGALKYLQSPQGRRTGANLPAGLVERREHGAECHVPASLPALRRLSRRGGILSGMRSSRLDFAGLQVGFAGYGLPRFRRRRSFACGLPPGA
jgi:hypothetical protein